MVDTDYVQGVKSLGRGVAFQIFWLQARQDTDSDQDENS